MHVWVVTGGSGFLGEHVLDALGNVDVHVVSIGRTQPHAVTRSAGRIAFHPIDLRDPARLVAMLSDLTPDVVLHLAGKTPPAAPTAFYEQNVLATSNVLAALRATGKPARLIATGSAAELGPVPIKRLPVDEAYPCHPQDPYALSKWFATASVVRAEPPVEGIVARLFNPIGPGVPASQALGRFASILSSMSLTPMPALRPTRLAVGDLEPRRDFIDVRDAAAAIIALAISGRPGQVYHVGTGISRSVGDALGLLIDHSGLEVLVESRSGIVATGPVDSRACIEKLQRDTGWKPQFTWKDTLRDLWDDALVQAHSARRNRESPRRAS